MPLATKEKVSLLNCYEQMVSLFRNFLFKKLLRSSKIHIRLILLKINLKENDAVGSRKIRINNTDAALHTTAFESLTGEFFYFEKF